MKSMLIRAASAAFLLSAIPIGGGPAWAVSTAQYTPSATAWTDLGAGPLQVQVAGNPCFFAVADATPGPSDPGFYIGPASGLSPYQVQTSSHVYTKSAGSACVVIVSPISSSGGSGGGGGSVTQGTSPWVDNITQWGSVPLAGATAFGTAPTGNVAGVNAYVTNPVILGAGSAAIGSITNTSFAATQSGAWTVAVNNFPATQAVTNAGTFAVQNTAATPPGSNVIGKVGIDQTTPGTTNGVVVNSSALPTNAATASNQNSTAAGTSATNAQGVQGVTGGVPANTIANASALAGGISTIVRVPSWPANNTPVQIGATGSRRLYRITGENTAAGPRRVKCYNTAAAPTIGTTTPFLVKYLPTTTAFSFDMADIGWSFSAGLWCTITQLGADTDTSAPAAGDITDLSFEAQ